MFLSGTWMFGMMGLALLAAIFWIWVLVEVMRSDMPNDEKLLWVLVVVFLNIIGAALYLLIAYKKAPALRKGRRPALARPKDNRIVAGVCAGVARYLGYDTAMVRLVFALLTVFTGFVNGILAYVIAWVIIPPEGRK